MKFVTLHIPDSIARHGRIVTTHISTPSFWQRAWFVASRQWFVVRRRYVRNPCRTVSVEWSRQWGVSLFIEGRTWRIELGCTGALVLDLRGQVAGSVLGPARYL